MRYQQIASSGQFPYPNHNVDPSKKNANWCMAYARAAYADWEFVYPKGVFANNGGDYEKFRMYALGKQPNSQYKTWLGVDNQTNETWMSIDWSIRSIVSPYRDRTISRLMKNELEVVATPIDMLANSEMEDYYSNMRAKLMVRKLIQQTNENLASHPLIELQAGEPMDTEELGMRLELGEQFNRSKDAELAIDLGFYENNYKEVRKRFFEDLFDLGVAGYKEWLGDDNKPKFRNVDPNNVVTSFSKKSDFSDIVHAGELIQVPLVELAALTDKDGNRMFTDEQLQEFAGTLAGKFGNPPTIGANTKWLKVYDKFKCQVFDIEFFSYNDYSYADVNDKNGNSDFRKAEYGRGKKSDKYIRKRIQVTYKCKWIVGTEYCYDWGLCYDPKRSVDVKNKAKTSLSYKFAAFNFYEMKAQGFMERLIPYLDDYQLTMLKIQNFKNRAVPSGWWFNLDALENVALNKGGANMTPRELLKMFMESGIMVGRSLDQQGQPMFQNTQPVIPIANTAAAELAMFYQDLINTVSAIEKITGYNEITTGNPNPKTLVPGYELANQSTQDAIYPLLAAEKSLTAKLAEDVLCRMQQGVKKGGVSGYARALNANILKFIQVSPEIALRDYGIMLEEKTTDEQKTWLLQQMQGDIQNGLLDSSDAVMLVNTHNVKQAQAIWAYRVKKAKEDAHNRQMQLLQEQNNGNMQTAQISEQAKQQTLEMEWQYELQKEQLRIQGELEKERMRLETQVQIAQMELGVKQYMNTESNITKQGVADITANAKVTATQLDREGKIVAADIAGEKAKERQEIANKKPVASPKK